MGLYPEGKHMNRECTVKDFDQAMNAVGFSAVLVRCTGRQIPLTTSSPPAKLGIHFKSVLNLRLRGKLPKPRREIPTERLKNSEDLFLLLNTMVMMQRNSEHTAN